MFKQIVIKCCFYLALCLHTLFKTEKVHSYDPYSRLLGLFIKIAFNSIKFCISY